MSTINTNSINVNYPIPGINNNSQGFRDNFASIVTNLNTAGTEITDLQNKVVVKQALTGTTLNNDMANTLISNASVRSFRSTTYNLGNALSGTVLVDTSLGDVQYGAVASNTTFNFGSWAPAGTQANVQLNISVSNSLAVITFSGNVVVANANNNGVSTLENFSNIGGLVTLTAPAGVTQLNYLISTTDCGNTLYISPINRPRVATQLQQRIVPPTGLQGDVAGDVAVGPSFNQLTITGANTDPYLTTSGNTTQLYTDLPIVFTGTSLAGNIVVGTTYYVKTIVANNKFTISSTVGGANIAIGANASGTTMFAAPVSYLYLATSSYTATACATSVTSTTSSGNVITLSGNLSSLSSAVNKPIVFDGNIGGLIANTVYYIKTVASPNITVSQSRTNGVAGSTVVVSSNTTATTATYYVGNDIWQRIALAPW
jgi:hypothetical protein